MKVVACRDHLDIFLTLYFIFDFFFWQITQMHMVHRMRSYVMTFFVQSFYFLPCHVTFFIVYIITYHVECGLKAIFVKNWFCMSKLSLKTIIKIYYDYFIVCKRWRVCQKRWAKILQELSKIIYLLSRVFLVTTNNLEHHLLL